MSLRNRATLSSTCRGGTDKITGAGSSIVPIVAFVYVLTATDFI